VEDDLPLRLAGGAATLPAEDPAVGEREQRGRHGATGTPPTMVIHGAPLPVHPPNGVLRDRERKRIGSTVHGCSRSRIVRSAAAPGAAARASPGASTAALGPRRRAILVVGSPVRPRLAVRSRGGRGGSGVERTPRALASRIMRTAPAVERWAMCTWAPVSSAS